MTHLTETSPLLATIDTDETAAVLKISQETVCEYISRGWLTATRVGRRWLVHRRSVMRLLETGTPPMAEFVNPSVGRSASPQ